MWNSQLSQPLIIGHRGAAGLAPENTIPAIDLAISLGVDAVEVDIHLAHDRLVVIHDDTLDRTTNGRGAVKECSLAALRSLDAGRGAQIPFLEEVLDLTRGRTGLVIEIKDRAAVALLAERLDSEVSSGRWSNDQLLVISFDQPALVQLKQYLPAAHIAPLVYGVPYERTAGAEKIGAVAFNGSFKTISAELIEDARSRSLKYLTYTPNTQDELTRLIAMGVNGVTTDFPDRAAAARAAAAVSVTGSCYE